MKKAKILVLDEDELDLVYEACGSFQGADQDSPECAPPDSISMWEVVMGRMRDLMSEVSYFRHKTQKVSIGGKTVPITRADVPDYMQDDWEMVTKEDGKEVVSEVPREAQ